jgi:LPS sulfotransferase NodH
LLCGTPRTGSTLLCDLLASTGVAGRPESYFREPDAQMWADRFGVSAVGGRPSDYQQFVVAAVRAGSTPNGVFAARIMWGTMRVLVEGLDPRRSRRGDVRVLTDTLGPLRFVHLRRRDVIGQAVSWARAEQSGFWQPGDTRTGEPHFDPDQIGELVERIHSHNAAWSAWFAEQGVKPVDVEYESVVDAPRSTVDLILRAIGAECPAGWSPTVPHIKQADAMNRDWVQRYLATHG